MWLFPTKTGGVGVCKSEIGRMSISSVTLKNYNDPPPPQALLNRPVPIESVNKGWKAHMSRQI